MTTTVRGAWWEIANSIKFMPGVGTVAGIVICVGITLGFFQIIGNIVIDFSKKNLIILIY